MSESKVDECPVCGAASIASCVGPDGELLNADHPGRPTKLPEWLGVIPPHAD